MKYYSKLDRLVRFLIPPSLIILLTITIIELFYGVGKLKVFIDLFDTYIILIFAIDLFYRWKDTPHFVPYVKKHILDIIATIPFNLIFWGVEGINLIRALRGARAAAKGIKIVARASRLTKLTRYTRFLRYLRFGARAPRFLRARKQIKKTKIRKVQPHEKKLKSTLSFKVILLITINSIMGTGIWFLTSAGAKQAGPASLISWGILSLVSIYIAMCFSELTAMFPKAGGVYEFAKQTYGRFWSFVIGWTTSIAGSVTIAMLLLGSLQYLIPLKYAFTYIPAAIFLIIIFSYVAYRGMNTSKFMLVTFALITLTAVVAIIIPGFINFDPTNYKPFFVFPTMSIVLAIFFIAETFFGWESAIFLSAETKNPTKVMPKALIWGTVVISILAFLLAFTAMGSINWQIYSESAAPLRDLGEAHFGSIGRILFTILIFVSVIGATAGWIVTAPRLLMSIAEDKLFFVQFAKIHPKHKSPYISIMFQVLVVSALVVVGAGSYETLLHMLIPLIIVLYSAVLLAVAVLRFKRPDVKRPYKVFAGKVGPFLTIGFMAFLLLMFIRETHGALDILRVSGSLIVFGIPAYFAIELFYDKKYVTTRKNILAHLTNYYHKIPLLQPTFNKLISIVGGLNKNKVVMDYNSKMGAFTRRILQKRYSFKHLHLVNQSKEEVKIINKNIHNKKVSTYVVNNFSIPNKKVDVFVSFQTLSYVKNIPSFLKDMHKSLNSGGKFCFYVRSRFFDVAPNSVEIENKKEMIKIFKEAKLKMNYSIKKRFYKKEIYICGEK